MKLTQQRLIDDGFKLENYPDGDFWILRIHPELFMQVDEHLDNITLYQNGWVDDQLNFDEYEMAVPQLKSRSKK